AGTRMLSGRDFDSRDDANSPPRAIVNQTFARRVMGTEDATGKYFRFGGQGARFEVVGMVQDGKYETLTERVTPALFRPILQSYISTSVMLVRTKLPEAGMAARMHTALAALDPRLPVYGVGSWTQLLGFAFFPSHAATVALSAFGVLAIMLAAT